tara:strand:- start:547 stop:1461 length:915 start_codon:yes stop_codon:yes gene_type:complete
VSLKKFKKIVILSGGISEEKDISKLTANEVHKILCKKYKVELLNVTHNGKKLIDSLIKINPDVAFNCLHGFFGEDGQVQSILNFLKIPYTHSGVMTSSVLMNKKISKIIFSKLNVLTPKSIDIMKKNFEKKIFPLIAKPVNGGSSNNLFKINNKKDLEFFLKKNQKIVDNFIFEEFIPGREITVGILENKICGVMEIVFNSEIYDFKNKYIKIAKHIINPKVPKLIFKRLNEISLKIHKIMGCNCISRLDFRYNEKKNEIYLLEVNTQPGLTKNSLLPEMAEKIGIDFFTLCKILIENSICEKS